MYLENTSFDAVITDSKGQTLEVDCRVSEPLASGLSADISIEIPLTDTEHLILENPCTLYGIDGGCEIEIKKLYYRSISAGKTYRKHGRGNFDIYHADQLWIRLNHWKSERALFQFHLSPIRFLKEHGKAKMVNYSKTPHMVVELFKIRTAELGEIRFIKHWSVHHIDKKGVAAEIRASFAAEIRYDETTAPSVDKLVEKMKEVLICLSILTRQAITVHGWRWERNDGLQNMWFSPLKPTLAPDMAEKLITDLCFPHEFEVCAQSFVEGFLAGSADLKEAVTVKFRAIMYPVAAGRSFRRELCCKPSSPRLKRNNTHEPNSSSSQNNAPHTHRDQVLNRVNYLSGRTLQHYPRHSAQVANQG